MSGRRRAARNTKTCNRCDKDKPYSDFARDERMLDRHSPMCRRCTPAATAPAAQSPRVTAQCERCSKPFDSSGYLRRCPECEGGREVRPDGWTTVYRASHPKS